MTPAFPSEVPTPGRWIRSDRNMRRGPRVPRLVGLSSQTLSGGGLRADPGQKHDPGEGHTLKKGLTQTGPLQKRMFDTCASHIAALANRARNSPGEEAMLLRAALSSAGQLARGAIIFFGHVLPPSLFVPVHRRCLVSRMVE